MSDPVTITSSALTAQIDPVGAELISLKDKAGREFMSDGDPAYWSGRAPVLFPIVGALSGGAFRHQGKTIALGQHGFARKSLFAVNAQTESEAIFRLTDDTQTRAQYPFAFALDLAFALDGQTLAIEARVRNIGETPMPFSFGYHPAFAWPLPNGGDKLGHRIEFAQDEHADIRRIDSRGLIAGSEPSPLDNASLALAPDLFESDALIWDVLESRKVTYRSPDGPAIALSWEDMPYLGIWQVPGASFICIEPWAGHADPQGFAADISEKPGVIILAPGEQRDFPLAITLSGV